MLFAVGANWFVSVKIFKTSIIINFFRFLSSQAPNETEMFEGMQNSNNNTNQSDSITSDDTITDQRDQVKWQK